VTFCQRFSISPTCGFAFRQECFHELISTHLALKGLNGFEDVKEIYSSENLIWFFNFRIFHEVKKYFHGFENVFYNVINFQKQKKCVEVNPFVMLTLMVEVFVGLTTFGTLQDFRESLKFTLIERTESKTK